jgi:hypothetical protein
MKIDNFPNWVAEYKYGSSTDGHTVTDIMLSFPASYERPETCSSRVYGRLTDNQVFAFAELVEQGSANTAILPYIG